MQAEMVAVTFADKKGAEILLKTLGELASGDLSEPDDVVIVVKDEEGQVRVMETAVPALFNAPAKVSIPGLVVGLLLGGPAANTLLGEAAGTLLAHHIDLGLPSDKIDMIANDMTAGSSMLFMQGRPHWNGSFHKACDNTGGKLYDLPMTRQAVTEVKILSSTLNHYWT